MKKQNAFTLIELLIVVAIIAILAAIAVPNFLAAQTRAKVSRVLGDLRTQRGAVEAYNVDFSTYPRMTWGAPPFNDVYVGKGSPLQPIFGTLGPWITTPVAYLSEFDNTDPFATNPKIPADTKMYTYQDLKTFRILTPPSGTGGDPGLAGLKFFEDNFGAYGQMSIGPDRDPEINEAFYAQYDPTNGTISEGNIWVSQKSTDRVAIKGAGV